jgi:transcriptional regulator with XRE-family HTH domain
MANKKDNQDSESLISTLLHMTSQVAGGTLDLARNTATMTAMFGESWARSALLKNMEPERLEAMADAGHFLRDARQTAGLSLKELAEALGVSDDNLLRDIESGDRIMPLELVLRATSLIARHDPIPFLIKFMRTYNPSLGETLEQWGILTLPMQYERERRFVNIYRQHDVLRKLDDDEFDRLIHYVDSATNLVLDVMLKEKEAKGATASAAQHKAAEQRKAPAKTRRRRKTPAKAKAKAKTKAKAP